MEWKKSVHPAYSEWEHRVKNLKKFPSFLYGYLQDFPHCKKWHYTSGAYSIIQINRAFSSPISCWKPHKSIACTCPRNYIWEAYDGDGTMTFNTLKEAKKWCEDKEKSMEQANRNGEGH